MSVIILDCAEAEFAAAVDYYNLEFPGLGYEFAAEVQRTLERITDYPEAWPMFTGRSRRCLTNRFPYGILYEVRADNIIVGAIMHLRRNPQHCRERSNLM